MAVAVAPGVRATTPFTVTWDAAAGVYIRAGRVVDPAAVEAATAQVIAGSGLRARALSQALVDGTLDLATWQAQMAGLLKALHVAVGTVARGGVAQMSPAAYGAIGQQLRQQYAYLRDFAADIAAGQQALDGRVLNRATLYTDAARGTSLDTAARRARERGATEERWVLRASEHCGGCVDRAGRGWQPVGELPGFGTQPCRSRCRCALESRRGRRRD